MSGRGVPRCVGKTNEGTSARIHKLDGSVTSVEENRSLTRLSRHCGIATLSPRERLEHQSEAIVKRTVLFLSRLGGSDFNLTGWKGPGCLNLRIRVQLRQALHQEKRGDAVWPTRYPG
jgi:hypothetical protein